MLQRGGERRGEKRQPRQNRDRVAVRGAGEAVEPVPAETGLPVQVRLEVGEAERRGGEEERGADGEPAEAQSWARRVLDERPLAHAERREPDGCSRHRDEDGQGAERGDRQGRATGAVL